MATATAAHTAVPGRLARIAAVTARNVIMLRTARSYGLLVLSGFLEPVLYLLAIGWGVGSLVGDVTLPGGGVVAYRDFLAPALLAASAMNGALAEATINFFAKMKYLKVYEAILNTPVRPGEIAYGELGWAMLRGAVYCGAFLIVMSAMGVTTVPRALLALPATLLVGLAFGGLGMGLSSYLRNWQDFEYLGLVQFAMLLFSGTFVPAGGYPGPLRVVVEATPLFHGVRLLRDITLGQPGLDLLVSVAYLVGFTVAGLALAARRMNRVFGA
jgi:lipooligosaccharide transport system permease protein